jgi:hypothetical protein
MKLLFGIVIAYAVGVSAELAFFPWLCWSLYDLFATPGMAPANRTREDRGFEARDFTTVEITTGLQCRIVNASLSRQRAEGAGARAAPYVPSRR